MKSSRWPYVLAGIIILLNLAGWLVFVRNKGSQSASTSSPSAAIVDGTTSIPANSVVPVKEANEAGLSEADAKDAQKYDALAKIKNALLKGRWDEIELILDRYMATNAVALISDILKDPDLHQHKQSVLLMALEKAKPADVAKLIDLLEQDEEAKKNLGPYVEVALASVARQDPDAAIRLFQSRADSTSDLYGLSYGMVQSIIENSGEAGLQKIYLATKNMENQSAIIAGAVASLAETKPESVLSWMNKELPKMDTLTAREALLNSAPALISNGHGKGLDELAASNSEAFIDNDAAAELARMLAVAEPKSAMEWLYAIDDPSIRQEANESVLPLLAQLSPEIVSEYLKSNPDIDADLRQRLTETLGGQGAQQNVGSKP